MHLTDKIATLHPAIVTTLTLVWFVAGGIWMNMEPLGGPQWVLIYSITMASFFPLVLLWHYSIYRAASDRSASFVGHRGRRALLFLLCAVGISSLLVALPMATVFVPATPIYRTTMMISTAGLVIGNISYFAAVWAAANALTRFDEKAKQTQLHKTLGTFLLQIYFPIGIWFTHPRIKNMVAAPVSSERLP